MGILDGKIEIDKIKISQSTSDPNSDEFFYTINLDISLNTRMVNESSFFSDESFLVPDLDLSAGMPIYIEIKYESESSPSSTIHKLEYQTFIGDEINPSLLSLEEGKVIKEGTPLKYSFNFIKRIKKAKNIKIVIIPFLASQLDEQNIAEAGLEFTKRIVASPISQSLFSYGFLQIEKNIEDLRTDYYGNLFSFDVSPKNTSRPSFISDLMPSYGKDNNIKSLFMINKIPFLQNKSAFSYFLESPSDEVKNEIIKLSRIEHLLIYRQRIQKNRDFHKKPLALSSNEIKKTIIVTSESSGKLKNSSRTSAGKTVAQIGEIDLNFIKFGTRAIAFNDSDNNLYGEFSYGIEMKMLDGPSMWLSKSLEELYKIQEIINNFYLSKYIVKNTSAQPTTEKRTIPKFLKILSTLNPSIKNNIPLLKKEFTNLLNHEGSITEFMRYNKQFIDKIETLINNWAPISQNNDEKSSNYSKNNTNLFTLEYSSVFPTTVIGKNLTNLNYDYIDINKNDSLGPSTLTEDLFKERLLFEYEKVIDSVLTGADLNQKIQVDTFTKISPSQSYFDFENNRFSYLSPKKIRDITITKENAFDNILMNEIHYLNKGDLAFNNPELSISYYMLSLGISLDSRVFSGLQDKKEQEKNSTYINASTIFSESDKLNSRDDSQSSPNPSPLQTFEGPTDTRSKYNSFINSILKQEENWNLNKGFFDIKKIKKSEISNMPNQIRALFAGKSEECTNRWLATEGDFFMNPDTYYMIKENFMNLVKIEVLEDLTNIRDPKFVKFTKKHFDNNVKDQLCRISLYNNKLFKVGVGFEERNYPDKYFIMNGTKTQQPSLDFVPNPSVRDPFSDPSTGLTLSFDSSFSQTSPSSTTSEIGDDFTGLDELLKKGGS